MDSQGNPRQSLIEYHCAKATEHQIEVDHSITLTERKVKTTVSDESGEVMKIILHHTRSMLDTIKGEERSYVVREVTEGDKVTEHEVTTAMGTDELEEFKREWAEKWCPTLTEEHIEQITESLPQEVEELAEDTHEPVYERISDAN